MKTLFLEARSKELFDIPLDLITKLPKKVGLFTTVQFLDNVQNITKTLKENNIEVLTEKGILHTKYPAQILGCDATNAEKIKDKVDAFLYVGTGLFHPKLISIKTEKEVFLYNPFNKTLDKIDNKEITKMKGKMKANYVKFLSSNNIGILVSTKPGQNKFKQALKLKNKLKDKNTSIFLTDTLNMNELDNFPFIEVWVNTMCPRIGMDDIFNTNKTIVNIEDIK